jgi:hypothetical protein
MNVFCWQEDRGRGCPHYIGASSRHRAIRRQSQVRSLWLSATSQSFAASARFFSLPGKILINRLFHVGGTSVSGGKPNVAGLWGAALFLVLLLTMLNTFGVSAGIRFVVTGLVIIAVIIAAGGQKSAR